MLLSRKTTIHVSEVQTNILNHMNYAASKLWNVCNYEKRNYKTLSIPYPNWYDQKSRLKDNIWFKSLPSQTAQEICNQIDQAFKSYYKLLKTGGIKSPKPPKFKQEGIPITYMQNGIVHNKKSAQIRLSIPKNLKVHMAERFDIHENYLFLENKVFQDMENIKQIKLYPPVNGELLVILIYEIPEVGWLPDNSHYIAIDLGIKNLMTCYDSLGNSFIIGNRYLEVTHYFNKKIAHYQSISDSQQASKGIKYPKSSKRVLRLYKKKRNSIKDILHKSTKYIVDYCLGHHIYTVIIGDIKHIRDNNSLDSKINQVFHAWPFREIYLMLEYKLKQHGIRFIRIKESYSSQCSPLSKEVSKRYANKSNRIKRGLYKEAGHIWNADAVGAYNIMRLYFKQIGRNKQISYQNLGSPIKVAA